MTEFLRLSPPAEALQILLSRMPNAEVISEGILTKHSLGRVLAMDIQAKHPLPEFPRSTVDGYAVRACDTFGASETIPGYLAVIGEILMGTIPNFSIELGTAALIHTGGMLPKGADAVIMLEHTQLLENGDLNTEGRTRKDNYLGEVEISRAVTEGENILQIGEDVEENQVVILKGTRMRAVEIGGCMALGKTGLRVSVKPKIGIISSGDEVVPPGRTPRLGQVRDINSYSLASLVESVGGDPILYGIVSDNLQVMRTTALKALGECQALLITAGSSASSRDTTAEAISSLGSPGVIIHGVNVRPGKPTILAICRNKVVIGLPGNPVSAYVIGNLFVVPVIKRLLGEKTEQPKPSIHAILSVNVSSQAGREEWIAVKILRDGVTISNETENKYIAEPIFGKSNLIFSLAKADGLIRVSPDATGISSGETVEVFPM